MIVNRETVRTADAAVPLSDSIANARSLADRNRHSTFSAASNSCKLMLHLMAGRTKCDQVADSSARLVRRDF
jgi:hypothetical protein